MAENGPLGKEGVRPGTRGWFQRGRWMIERERCRLTSAEPTPPFRDADSVQKGLRSVLGRMGLQSVGLQSVLIDEWPQLVGEDVARRTRPGSVLNRELTVYVRGAVWYAELKRCGVKTMQDKIVARLGPENVNRVVLRPDPEGGVAPAERPASPPKGI